MAVAKKVKPASGDTKNKKSSPAKPAPKPAAKPVKKTAPTKSAAKPTPKKVETKSSKSDSKPATKTAAKPASLKEPAKKQTTATKVPVAKTQIKKEVAKTKQATPVKSVSPAKKEPVTTKPLKSATPAAKTPSSKPASNSAKASVKNAPSKQTANAKDSGKKEKLKTPDPAELAKEFPDMDPADLKAQKIMKELEETMDLAAVKPRIKVPTVTKTIVKRDHHNAPLKLVEPTNTNKQKFQLEFEFRSSPKILFNALSDSSGLAGWFADEVRTKDDQFTFVWEGGESYAKLVAIKDMYLVRFQWAEDTDGTYFQFEIKQDELTGEIALVITDFALPGERETNIRLWESQVQNLRMLLGSL